MKGNGRYNKFKQSFLEEQKTLKALIANKKKLRWCVLKN